MMRTQHLGVVTAVAVAVTPSLALADEGGVSFWLPGQMSSFAAVPGEPGFALPLIYYHWTADAGASREFDIAGNIVAGLDVRADFVFIAPTYTFADSVAGGQLSVSLILPVGRVRVGADAVIIGPLGDENSGSRTDELFGAGDLYLQSSLKWAGGNHNGLVYAMTSLPVGAYEVGRLANIGLNHWSVDVGGGYTYLDTKGGHELSVVGGLTYNFENDDTDYQSGVDGHIDWAASQFLNEQLHVGVVGYIYYQLSSDSGSGAQLEGFKSRVYAVGPQAGFLFPFGDSKGYVGLRGYDEFGAKRRVEGWNTYLTLSLPF